MVQRKFNEERIIFPKKKKNATTIGQYTKGGKQILTLTMDLVQKLTPNEL